MKKIISMLSLFLLAACTANKFEIQLNINLPASVDHAVQFSVIDFNPSEKFIKEFKLSELQKGLESSTNDTDKNAIITNSVMMNWDALFKDIPANDYWLMNSQDSATYSKTGGIFIPLPVDWWVVSKAFLLDGKPYCYIVPLEIKKGSKISCRPDKGNLVSLIEMYEKQIIKNP